MTIYITRKYQLNIMYVLVRAIWHSHLILFKVTIILTGEKLSKHLYDVYIETHY